MVLNAVTRLMGRKDMLLQTLPTWLAISELSKIIVVDWGCKEDLAEIKAIADTRVWILHVPGMNHWRQGEPWNIGDRFADDGWIFNIDCDIKIIDPRFLTRLDLGDHTAFHTCDKQGHSLTGSCIVTKKQYEAVNGYVEGLSGYGSEDLDFYHRLSRVFRQQQDLITGKIGGVPMFEHIPHGKIRRIENTEFADMITWRHLECGTEEALIDQAYQAARTRNERHMREVDVLAQARPAFQCLVWNAGRLEHQMV